MTILERIDELRNMRGWSVNNLAMEAALTQSTLNNLYVRQTEPKISTLRAVCDAFGITIADFFNGMEIGTETIDETDAELKQRVSALNKEEKNSLLVILRAMQNNRG